MAKRVFVLGATGYIGGAVFVRVKASFPEWTYAALSRSEKNDAALTKAGVNEIVRGSHGDVDLIRAEAAKADVVIAGADADDLELARAVLDGLAERVTAGKAPGVLIHTSGTGVVSDKSEGAWTPYADKVWNDANEEDIKSIPPEKPHRNVDLLVFDYDAKKLVNAYIIAPSTIYGIADAPVNKISQQIPVIVTSDVKLKKAVIVGEGTNIWNNVHIDDLVELYDLVLKRALSNADAHASPYAKFYFGSVGTHVFGEVQREIGGILYSKGLVPNKEPEHVDYKELAKDTPLLIYVAINAVAKSDRGFAIGWKPSKPSLQHELLADVEATLARI